MDHIIIGAGIAGLYAAYQLKRQNKSFIILEKSSKKDIGGRMGSPLFHGTRVAKGAGVGRKRKDKLLIQLLDELKVPYTEYKSRHQYADTISPDCNVKETFLYLKHSYENSKEFIFRRSGTRGGGAGEPRFPAHSYENSNHKSDTFKGFAEPLLGKRQYQHFITCVGYTDYENEDVESTLYDYGFDDNYLNWTGLSIPWDVLLTRLIETIGAHNIHHNTEVTDILKDQTNNNYVIHTVRGKTYTAPHLIIAVTITPLRKLLPAVPEYKHIRSQPFLRIYGKFSKASIPFMEEKVAVLTVVPGPLYKIIPINPDDGIYMIVYTDNKGALALKGHKENTPENRRYLCGQLERALGLPSEALTLLSIVDFYWEDGTHYYTPLPEAYGSREEFIYRAQHPYPNMLVIGEAVSQNQGWVEGALKAGNLRTPSESLLLLRKPLPFLGRSREPTDSFGIFAFASQAPPFLR
jgi:hypothetical protein